MESEDTYCICFSQDGLLIATGSGNGKISVRFEFICYNLLICVQIWNFPEKQIHSELEGHTDYVNSVAFSPNGKFLVSGSNDNTIRIWEREQDWKSTVIQCEDWVYQIAISPNSQLIAARIDGSVGFTCPSKF